MIPVSKANPDPNPSDGFGEIGTFAAFVNPLVYLEAEEPWSAYMDPPSVETTLRYVADPNDSFDLDLLLTRYREIAAVEETHFVAIPAIVQVLNKMIWPLRSAKGSYMLGNYVATIGLCGMVGEMVATLAFDIVHGPSGSVPMTAEDQTARFGRLFELLHQDERVKELRKLGLVTDQAVTRFSAIRKIRRGYLHLLSHDDSQASVDALAAYKAAHWLVADLLDPTVRDGMIVFRPSFLAYLRRLGLITPPDDSDNPPAQPA